MSLQRPDFSVYVRSFATGYNDSTETDTLPLGSTFDARNAFLASVLEDRDAKGVPPRAIIRKRTCAQLLNPQAMSIGKSVECLCWFQPETSAPALLAVCNGSLYQWNPASASFTLLAPGAFTPGVRITTLQFKDNVHFMDGTTIKRWNGTQLVDMGFVAPTSAPGLAAASGGALDVGAIYEGFAVWWNQTMDHESSPSATSVQVTLTAGNQQRTWTKPSGSPPSNVTHWRIYCRRIDTNELNYFLAATVPIGTTSVTEATSDAARRTIGPKLNSNDPPPAFATMAVFKDYGIAIRNNESYYYVSKAGDLESWNPTDKFAVERGAEKPLRSVTTFGADVLLQKPARTWRLSNDRPPFKLEPVHSSFGNVGPLSALEIEKTFYAWDEARGPYRTDLVDWEPLATDRITTFLKNLNRDELVNIRIEHDAENGHVIWAVPASSRTDTRRRHLLAFNYRLNCWLPPITGLEYASLVAYQPPGGVFGLYGGDYWGRVYKLFEQDREGVPTGETIIAPVTSATAGSVTCTGANFYHNADGLAGMPVLVESPSGVLQWRRIQSNTPDTITLDTTNNPPWQAIPGPGYVVHLGAVDFYWTTPWVDCGRPDLLKRGGFLFVEGKSTAAQPVLRVFARFNQNPGALYAYDFAFAGTGATWGSAIWGVGLWGHRQRVVKKRRINRAFYSMQIRLDSPLGDRPVDVTTYGLEGDSRIRKRSAGPN